MMNKQEYISSLSALTSDLCSAVTSAGDGIRLREIRKKAEGTVQSVLSALIHDFMPPYSRGDIFAVTIALRGAIGSVPDVLPQDVRAGKQLSGLVELCRAIDECMQTLVSSKKAIEPSLSAYLELSAAGKIYGSDSRLSGVRSALAEAYEAVFKLLVDSL